MRWWYGPLILLWLIAYNNGWTNPVYWQSHRRRAGGRWFLVNHRDRNDARIFPYWVRLLNEKEYLIRREDYPVKLFKSKPKRLGGPFDRLF